MGLFDFLKKKKLTQSSSAKELNAHNSQGIQSKESALPFWILYLREVLQKWVI